MYKITKFSVIINCYIAIVLCFLKKIKKHSNKNDYYTTKKSLMA